MSKVKSFQLLFAIIFCVTIFACSGSGTSTNNGTTNVETSGEASPQSIEAQTQEFENVETDIESKIEDLDAALNALEF